MVQRTNNSYHSNQDITIDNPRISNDDSSISKEKYDLEVTTAGEISNQNTDDDHPDGGLTAWLIVAGVRLP